MEPLLNLVLFTGMVFACMGGMIWLLVNYIYHERRKGGSDLAYAGSVSGALFLFTFGVLGAKQVLIDRSYSIGIIIIFALVPSLSAGFALAFLRHFFPHFWKRSTDKGADRDAQG